MALGKIASTTLETTPTDDLAVVDVYVDQPTENVNKEKPNEVKTAALEVADTLRKGIGIRELAKATSIEDGKASISKGDAVDLVKAATGGENSAVGGLNDAVANSLLKAVGFKDDKELADAAAAGGDAAGKVKTKKGYLTVSGIKTIYGTVQTLRAVKDTDLHSASGIANLLNSISGNSALAKVLDMDSQFAVLGSMVSKLSELGIIDAIDDILAKLANDKERKRLMIENLENFVYNSDLPSINKVITYIGPTGVLGKMPRFISTLLTFYHLPYGTATPTLQHKTDLLFTLDAVQPNWHLYNRNGVNILDLEPFTYASEDALNVLKMPAPAAAPFTPVSNVYYLSALIAKSFPSTDIIQKAGTDFPHAVLQTPNLY